MVQASSTFSPTIYKNPHGKKNARHLARARIPESEVELRYEAETAAQCVRTLRRFLLDVSPDRLLHVCCMCADRLAGRLAACAGPSGSVRTRLGSAQPWQLIVLLAPGTHMGLLYIAARLQA